MGARAKALGKATGVSEFLQVTCAWKGMWTGSQHTL